MNCYSHPNIERNSNLKKAVRFFIFTILSDKLAGSSQLLQINFLPLVILGIRIEVIASDPRPRIDGIRTSILAIWMKRDEIIHHPHPYFIDMGRKRKIAIIARNFLIPRRHFNPCKKQLPPPSMVEVMRQF